MSDAQAVLDRYAARRQRQREIYAECEAVASGAEMSQERAVELLAEAAGLGDDEVQHSIGDDVIIAFIRSRGFHDVADAWDKLGKWYA